MLTFLQNEAPVISIIGLCLIISAFFSAAETAITSLGVMKAKHLLSVQGKRVAPLKLWINHPGRVIATILLFNNILNILASAITTQLSLRYFENQAIGIATGVSTFLVLVFCEIVPKSFAKAYSEPIALWAMRIIQVVYIIMYPVIRALSGFAEFVIRLFRRGHAGHPLITEEEIEFLVNEGERAGVIEELKRDIIEGAFDFDETRVREIMTPRTQLKALELHATLNEIIKLALKTGHSRIPIYNEHIDHIVGVVLAKDLLKYLVATNDEVNSVLAKDLMRPCLLVPQSKTIMEVFKDLQKAKNHIAIIIDEYGGTAGVVTMEDILEEFVGEIQDEFDKDEKKIVKKDDVTFEVSGTTNLEDFCTHFKINLSEFKEIELDPDVETVAGLITALFGQIPHKGQDIEFSNFRFTVLVVENRQVKLVKVEIRS